MKTDPRTTKRNGMKVLKGPDGKISSRYLVFV